MTASLKQQIRNSLGVLLFWLYLEYDFLEEFG